MAGKIQGVVVRCLYEESLYEEKAEKFLKPYNGPVRLNIVLGSINTNCPDKDCSSRQIYSRLENLGRQLHVHIFNELKEELKEGAVLELKAKYYSPAKVKILQADITLFKGILPNIADCLDVDHLIP